jgi:hypothetical protein
VCDLAERTFYSLKTSREKKIVDIRLTMVGLRKKQITCAIVFSPNYKRLIEQILLFHRAFQFTVCNGPTNALVCNKTLIQMSHNKTLKITPRCFDHQLIIIRELI